MALTGAEHDGATLLLGVGALVAELSAHDLRGRERREHPLAPGGLSGRVHHTHAVPQRLELTLERFVFGEPLRARSA